MAIVVKPKLILLDEPAAGLSASERKVLRSLLENLPKDITFLLIEHDMTLALELVDRVLCLDNGTPLAYGTPDEIRANPAVQAVLPGSEGTDDAHHHRPARRVRDLPRAQRDQPRPSTEANPSLCWGATGWARPPSCARSADSRRRASPRAASRSTRRPARACRNTRSPGPASAWFRRAAMSSAA